MNIKRVVNKVLRKAGYEINRYKDPYREKDFSLNAVFSFFPRWVSKFEIDGETLGGHADYSSQRVSILNHPALSDYCEIRGKNVIEFGPLECGNTILLEKMGASGILAVEGHLENFIRACVIKNIFDLNSTKIVYNDAMAVKGQYGSFDLALVAGLLYHLDRPDLFLQNIATFSDSLILSTHIAGPASPSEEAPEIEIENKERSYRGKKYREYSGPNSGLSSYSFWPFRGDLIAMIEDSGFTEINILSERKDPNGYELIYLTAKKKK